MLITQRFFNFRWQYNDSSVFVDNTTPRIFAKEVAIKPTISIDIKDKQFGVNYNSIELYMNGFDITSASVITPITDGYRVTYMPTISFPYNYTVRITIKAANLYNIYMPDYFYWFRTVKERLVDIIEAKLKDISEEVDWDDIIDDRL